MIIASRIDERTKEQLDKLLSTGTYHDYSDVIVTAIHNLALLHDEMGEDRSLVVAVGKGVRFERGPRGRKQPSVSASSALRALWIFEHASLESAERPAAFAPPPDDIIVPGDQPPIDYWVFGQYSKLLPAKASVRALANLEIRDDVKFALDDTASMIALNAAALGEYLAHLDDRLQLQRDDALALGFPSRAENAEKSRLRYANQFVGSLNRTGVLSGLLVDLKLVNLMDTRTPRIQLTETGWDFALLRNAVLDELEPTGAKFTPEERSFLIEHINRSVPIEAFVYRTILRAIVKGANTPDALDAALKPYIPHRDRPITRPFVTTQRSGAVSRMVDIGLVTRVRDGVRVSYLPTDTGRAFAGNSVAA